MTTDETRGPGARNGIGESCEKGAASSGSAFGGSSSRRGFLGAAAVAVGGSMAAVPARASDGSSGVETFDAGGDAAVSRGSVFRDLARIQGYEMYDVFPAIADASVVSEGSADREVRGSGSVRPIAWRFPGGESVGLVIDGPFQTVGVEFDGVAASRSVAGELRAASSRAVSSVVESVYGHASLAAPGWVEPSSGVRLRLSGSGGGVRLSWDGPLGSRRVVLDGPACRSVSGSLLDAARVADGSASIGVDRWQREGSGDVME